MSSGGKASSSDTDIFFTRFFFFTLVSALVGFGVAIAPLGWKAMMLDIAPEQEALSGDRTVQLLYLLEFQYSSLLRLVNEALLCSIALGVTASLYFVEATIHSYSKYKVGVGGFASAYFVLCGLGLLGSIFFYTIMAQVERIPNLNLEYLEFWIKLCYHVFFAVVASYFLCLVQLRRVQDRRS